MFNGAKFFARENVTSETCRQPWQGTASGTPGVCLVAPKWAAQVAVSSKWTGLTSWILINSARDYNNKTCSLVTPTQFEMKLLGMSPSFF